MNIAEFLKDCPKGTKLYSPICGECELKDIGYLGEEISVITAKDTTCTFNKEGYYFMGFDDAEPVLFPSKENRDWSKFQRPFKDGDIVFYNDSISIFKEWGDETLFRTYVTTYTQFLDIINIGTPLFGKSVRREIRFATEEEKQKLFDAIKSNGYKWDEETKILEKLITPKFNVGDKIRSKTTGCEFTIVEINDNRVIVECMNKSFSFLKFCDTYNY